MSMEQDRSNSWWTWGLGEFFTATENVLRKVDFPPNASFSPVAMHFYKEGVLLDLKYRNQVYASTWLYEHASLEDLQNWAVDETMRFAAYRKEQRRLIKIKRSKTS